MLSLSSPRRFDRLIFILGLLLSLGFVAGQTIVRIEYIRMATRASAMPTELAAIPGIQPREITFPLASVDSTWWVMHTEAMLKSGDWRVRESTRDNAPLGREVHWSSGLMWLLAGLAWLIHLASGLSVGASVQHAALLAGPVMLCGFIVAFACVGARRWGGAIGGFLALALATLGPLDAFFRVGEADHHGIVTCFSLGCVLAIIAAGAGRVQRVDQPGSAEADAPTPSFASARRWMALSSLLGAAGLWVSAATVVPTLAGISLGALLAARLGRRDATSESTEAAPSLWRVWGAAGAVGSLGFYLLEYAPHHLGWRLEVNHPLYALAWLGGGDLLARACAWIQTGRFAPTARARLAAGCSLLGLIALPVFIRLGGVSVFTIQDHFLWHLHTDYIQEFRPLIRMFDGQNWSFLLENLPAWPILAVPALWLLFRRGRAPDSVALLAVALCACLPLTGLALSQVRWFSVGQTLWLAVPVVLLVLWRSATRPLAKPVVAGGLLCLLAGLGTLPALSIPQWRFTPIINLNEGMSLVMRDVAWKLRLQAGAKPINIISGPTTTTLLAFFGDTQGVGTLYWENLAGLKTAGAIYGAKNEADALALCREHAVTHIVIFSWDAFAQPYARLHHGRAVDASTEDCFVSALLDTRTLPAWLRPLPYVMLPQLAQAGHWARIFEVHPEQSPAEAFFYLGQYLAQSGHDADALTAYIQSWNLDSHSAATGHELGLSLVVAGRFDEATQIAAMLSPQDRLLVESALGERLARDGDHRHAIDALRRALALAPDDRANTTALAWLLATSDEASLRNGNEALALMTKLGANGQSLNYREIDALAAALAETGNFTDATRLIDRAIETARRDGSSGGGVVTEFETRRNRYGAALPLRVAPATPQAKP
jgi:tetratricopeptide (TPR) repeat protein